MTLAPELAKLKGSALSTLARRHPLRWRDWRDGSSPLSSRLFFFAFSLKGPLPKKSKPKILSRDWNHSPKQQQAHTFPRGGRRGFCAVPRLQPQHPTSDPGHGLSRTFAPGEHPGAPLELNDTGPVSPPETPSTPPPPQNGWE